MTDSILNSTKKLLGLDAAYTVFDVDIIMHINSVFGTLSQLGIGPANGFAISDASTTWTAYLGADRRFNSVKTYMFLKVRLLFDPPATSFAITAFKEEIKELEWRLNAQREEIVFVPNTIKLDGGAA